MKLKDIFEKPISGEWGKEVGEGEKGSKVIRTTNFTNIGMLDLSSIVERDIDSIKHENKKLKFGDIIIEKSGGSPTQPVGRVVIFEETNEEVYFCNNFTSILRPNKNIVPKFGLYLLKNLYNKKKVLKFQNKTTGIINIKLNDYLNNTEITIPNLEVQNRIVEVLNKTQELIDKRKEQIESLDELVKSKFIEMFGTPIEKRFIGKTLPEIIAEGRYSLKRGPFGGSLKKDDFIQEGYLVYEQRHAIHNDFDYAKYYISKDKYDEMIMFKVEPKDLLVSCSGVTLGRISEVPEGAKAGIINQALLKITLNQDIMNNIYFMQLFRNEQIQDKLFGFSRGSGIPNFPSMSEVKSMEFLCPPIELQNKFADFVNNIDKLKFEMEKSLKELEDNFNSLMQKAFKGELFK
ncbi:restriction endonuclease subunit S [Clostridium perfringens]|uniref:restriction endonuclease subunit S n=1 Tax=Clostridium perfringens TaxID=1502 RepID=UPI0024BD33A1|nr:restriction endonuclease subunit S [Clostridium perfringens]